MSQFSCPSPGRTRGHPALLELGTHCPQPRGSAGVIAGEILRSLYKKGLSGVQALLGCGTQPPHELPMGPLALPPAQGGVWGAEEACPQDKQPAPSEDRDQGQGRRVPPPTTGTQPPAGEQAGEAGRKPRCASPGDPAGAVPGGSRCVEKCQHFLAQKDEGILEASMSHLPCD